MRRGKGSCVYRNDGLRYLMRYTKSGFLCGFSGDGVSSVLHPLSLGVVDSRSTVWNSSPGPWTSGWARTRKGGVETIFLAYNVLYS